MVLWSETSNNVRMFPVPGRMAQKVKISKTTKVPSTQKFVPELLNTQTESQWLSVDLLY